MIEIIEKKKNKEMLTYEELSKAINGYVKGDIPDYQMSALLMAICINGMSDEETIDLTDIMLKSGETFDLSDIKGIKIDKHSSGGVGDKTSLIIGPIVSSLGIIVPKISGRGLGHTGGTIDKLESIPNFRTKLSLEEFKNGLKQVGFSLGSGTANLVPADKKIYALRDVTGTVQSIPLIASSIMSKKIAAGADKIVIDLKVGNGALINNLADAKKLANLMVKIGKKYNRETKCILTNMNEPLGNNIGNALEVIEAIDVLKGNIKNDLYDLAVIISSNMVSMGKSIALADAKKEVIKVIESGQAYKKFLEFVNYQGGNLDEIKLAPKIFSVKSITNGYINRIDTKKLGEIVKEIGGGREKLDDVIDHGVGIVLSKKIGDYVSKDEEILKIYLNQKDMEIRKILSCFLIEDTKKEKEPLVYDTIM